MGTLVTLRKGAARGALHNALPWRITNVRVQVDSIDANGAAYRPSVQAFDKVMLETSTPQAP